MGFFFSKHKADPAPATEQTPLPNLTVGHGESASIKGTDNQHLNKLTAEKGGVLTFSLQNLNSMNLQNLRQPEPEMINLATLSPIEQKLLMKLKAEREMDPASYVNHLAQLL